MRATDAPIITDELLSYLRARFPERSPDVSETLPQLHHRGGQTSVVRHLEAVQAKQNKDDARV